MSMIPELALRDITQKDEAVWRALWAQYLAFYKTELAPEVTNGTWARMIDQRSLLKGRLAVYGEDVIGFCLHHTHLSTWGLAPDCYLEDLFVTENARGKGAGRALIDDLIGICRAEGYGRLYWHTDERNARARALYDSYTPTDGHVRYRIKL